MDWVNAAGYLASVLVFGAFYMKAMVPLRAVAIASNVAFIAYGLAGALYPVLVLHAFLLPLNCLRLVQVCRLMRRVRAAFRGPLSIERLVPLMTRRCHRAGDVLFRMGEPARCTFVVLTGTVRVDEVGVVLGPGSLIGEVGLFAPGTCRTATVVCETDVELGCISDETLLKLCVEDPGFGLRLTRLVVERMLAGEPHRVSGHHTCPPERVA